MENAERLGTLSRARDLPWDVRSWMRDQRAAVGVAAVDQRLGDDYHESMPITGGDRAPAVVLALAVWGGWGTARAEPSERSFRLGVAAFEAGRAEEALAHLSEARQANPEWYLPELYWALAELELRQHSPAGIRAIEHVVAAAPANPRAHYHLARAYERIERWDDAAAMYRKAVALRPRLHDAQLRLGMMLREQGRDAEAIVELEKAQRLLPNGIVALASLAELYEAAGRLRDAEAALRRIARIHPTVAYHRYRIAELLERNGDLGGAARARKQAELVDPRPERRMRPLRPARR